MNLNIIGKLIMGAAILAMAGCSTTPGVTSNTVAPVDKIELNQRIEQLRKEYTPYLRSLPKPLKVRSRQLLCSDNWRSHYEVKIAKTTKRPDVPEWYGEAFDDSGWKQTEVPEWRYKMRKGHTPISCILWYRTKFSAEPPADGKRVFLVFEGVDWEAEVWLNGKRLGSHKVYYEPFKFDVTDILKENNTLAVRVIDGPLYGEPAAYWSIFPFTAASDQRYVREKSKSVAGYNKKDMHIGSGYGSTAKYIWKQPVRIV